MYYKEISGRIVFSTCKAILLENDYPELNLSAGQWISNPAPSIVELEGWREYVPPVVPPAPELEPDLTAEMEAVKRMFATQAEELTDEEALEVAAIFPTWYSKIGLEVPAGERLWYDEKLYKVVQLHTVQAEWTPDITPALYVEVTVVEWPEIPEYIPSTAPWMNGDKGTWKEQHYICQLDNCTWNPDQYPAAWRLVE